MELTGTAEQQLVFLNLHWGRMYVFAVPEGPGALWTAKAKFGNQDEMQAPSATELLSVVRNHYAAKRFPGSSSQAQ
jgi:hypothetical protein